MKKVLLFISQIIPLMVFTQWIDITPDLNEDLIFSDIHILNEDVIFFFGVSENIVNHYRYGLVLKTTDGGQSWEHIKVYHPNKDRGPFIRGGFALNDSTFAISCSDGEIKVFMGDSVNQSSICAFCDYDDIFFLKDSTIVVGPNYRTSYDLGLSWESIFQLNIDNREAFYRNEDTVVFSKTEKYDFTAKTYQKIQLSKNKGMSFKTLNVLSNNNEIKAITFKDSIVYAVGEQGFFGLTNDNFSAFEQIITTTNQELICIDIKSNKDWFIGGGFNIYEHDMKSGIILGTKDGVNLWYSSSFPDQIRKLKMYDSNIGYAITYNNIYKTTNGGIINVLEDDNIQTQLPYPNPTTDFLNTHSETEKGIYSIHGQLLWQGTESRIDVSSWSKGIYLLKTEGEIHKWIKH